MRIVWCPGHHIARHSPCRGEYIGVQFKYTEEDVVVEAKYRGRNGGIRHLFEGEKN